MEADKENTQFDPLDMSNYRMENLPVREKTNLEKWIAIAGAPLAIVAFILIMWVIPIPFLHSINPKMLSKTAGPIFAKVGAIAFSNMKVLKKR